MALCISPGVLWSWNFSKIIEVEKIALKHVKVGHNNQVFAIQTMNWTVKRIQWIKSSDTDHELDGETLIVGGKQSVMVLKISWYRCSLNLMVYPA